MFNAAVAGVGYTEFTAAAPESTLELARQACSAAIADAGLTKDDVDGVASFMVMHDSVPTQAVATVLGLPQLRFSLDIDLGGQAPCHLVAQAAAAVTTGQAKAVLVYRAMKGRSGPRVGSMAFSGGGGQYRYPIGYGAYMMYVAMWAQRFLAETGQGPADLAAVAITQRQYAEANSRAFRRRPLTLEQYFDAPMVVDPFRGPDCTIEVDGACAVLVTSVERARDLPHPPAIVAAGGYRAGARPGLDIGDHLAWRDYTRNYTSWIAADLYGQAGIGPRDVDFAEIYDCFTSTVLMGLEGLGLCERGGSGAFVQAGETKLSGRLPTNTHGGLLAEGYLHGMNTVAEAVLQIQGRGGQRQVSRNEVAAVTSGALMDGSALILTADRDRPSAG
jgi:acetyl-CoA acetyltransferase